MKIKFESEYKFGEKTVKEINIDVEKLSGYDFLECEKEFELIGAFNPNGFKEISDGWALIVAARASSVKYDDLLSLKGRDYVRVVVAMKGFLNGA